MDHDTLSLVEANRLAERIAEAKRLRESGASPDEIAAIEPTREEYRRVLMALRTNRAAAAARPAKSSRSTKPSPAKMGLMEFLKAEKPAGD